MLCRPLFRCIHCIDPPAVNDVMAMAIIDSSVAAATAAVVAAEAAEQDLIDAIAEQRRHHQSCRQSRIG